MEWDDSGWDTDNEESDDDTKNQTKKLRPFLMRFPSPFRAEMRLQHTEPLFPKLDLRRLLADHNLKAERILSAAKNSKKNHRPRKRRRLDSEWDASVSNSKPKLDASCTSDNNTTNNNMEILQEQSTAFGIANDNLGNLTQKSRRRTINNIPNFPLSSSSPQRGYVGLQARYSCSASPLSASSTSPSNVSGFPQLSLSTTSSSSNSRQLRRHIKCTPTSSLASETELSPMLDVVPFPSSQKLQTALSPSHSLSIDEQNLSVQLFSYLFRLHLDSSQLLALVKVDPSQVSDAISLLGSIAQEISALPLHSDYPIATTPSTSALTNSFLLNHDQQFLHNLSSHLVRFLLNNTKIHPQQQPVSSSTHSPITASSFLTLVGDTLQLTRHATQNSNWTCAGTLSRAVVLANAKQRHTKFVFSLPPSVLNHSTANIHHQQQNNNSHHSQQSVQNCIHQSFLAPTQQPAHQIFHSIYGRLENPPQHFHSPQHHKASSRHHRTSSKQQLQISNQSSNQQLQVSNQLPHQHRLQQVSQQRHQVSHQVSQQVSPQTSQLVSFQHPQASQHVSPQASSQVLHQPNPPKAIFQHSHISPHVSPQASQQAPKQVSQQASNQVSHQHPQISSQVSHQAAFQPSQQVSPQALKQVSQQVSPIAFHQASHQHHHVSPQASQQVSNQVSKKRHHISPQASHEVSCHRSQTSQHVSPKQPQVSNQVVHQASQQLAQASNQMSHQISLHISPQRLRFLQASNQVSHEPPPPQVSPQVSHQVSFHASYQAPQASHQASQQAHHPVAPDQASLRQLQLLQQLHHQHQQTHHHSPQQHPQHHPQHPQHPQQQHQQPPPHHDGNYTFWSA